VFSYDRAPHRPVEKKAESGCIVAPLVLGAGTLPFPTKTPASSEVSHKVPPFQAGFFFQAPKDSVPIRDDSRIVAMSGLGARRNDAIQKAKGGAAAEQDLVCQQKGFFHVVGDHQNRS